MPFSTMAIYSVAVLATVIVVRIVWVYAVRLPAQDAVRARIREREPAPTPAQVFVVALGRNARGGVVGRGVRGAVDDAVGSAVPRPATHRVPHLRGGDRHAAAARADAAMADPAARRARATRRAPMRSPSAAAQEKAAIAAAQRLDELLAGDRRRPTYTSAPQMCCARGTLARRTPRGSRLGRSDGRDRREPDVGVPRLRLEMLAAERAVVHRRTRQRTHRRRGAARRCCTGWISRKRRSTGRSREW